MDILIMIVIAVLAVVDLHQRIVPNIGPVVIALLGLGRVLTGAVSPGSALSGAALLGGSMMLLALLTNGVGGGDVKLLGALGAVLGPVEGAKLLFLSFFLSGIASAGILILPVIAGSAREKGAREIPFVPFIALAAFLIFLQNRL